MLQRLDRTKERPQSQQALELSPWQQQPARRTEFPVVPTFLNAFLNAIEAGTYLFGGKVSFEPAKLDTSVEY